MHQWRSCKISCFRMVCITYEFIFKEKKTSPMLYENIHRLKCWRRINKMPCVSPQIYLCPDLLGWRMTQRCDTQPFLQTQTGSWLSVVADLVPSPGLQLTGAPSDTWKEAWKRRWAWDEFLNCYKTTCGCVVHFINARLEFERVSGKAQVTAKTIRCPEMLHSATTFQSALFVTKQRLTGERVCNKNVIEAVGLGRTMQTCMCWEKSLNGNLQKTSW